MTHQSVADAIGTALPTMGVRHLFGLVGSGNFEMAAAASDAGVAYIPARHEAAAVAMANGYAQVARRVGVATVHQGPGFTNALTSLVEAVKSRTPLVLLAADTAASDGLSNFALDQARVAGDLGAQVIVIDEPGAALDDLAMAFSRAICERRVVTVLLPIDVQAAPLPQDTELPPWWPSTVVQRPPSQDSVDAAVRLIAASARPLVVAGRGATISEAHTELVRLAESAGALVGTTAMAKGMFRDDPYDVGALGWFCPPARAAVVREADLVIAFGASLNRWTTCDGQLLNPDATIIQVDDDAAAIGVHRRVDLAVIGDVALSADAITTELKSHDAGCERWRTRETNDRIAHATWPVPSLGADADAAANRVDPRRFTQALGEILPDEVTLASDSGHFLAWPAMYLTVPDPQGHVFAQAFQSVGLGLATAIGAHVARPDRLTIAPVGDGGALMAAGELETIGRSGFPILVLIYNDAAYGAEIHHFGHSAAAEALACFAETDFAGLARSVGCNATTVCTLDDLSTVEDWLERRDGPLVVDVKIDRSVVVSFLEDSFRSEPAPSRDRAGVATAGANRA